jgi:hypothetical protein
MATIVGKWQGLPPIVAASLTVSSCMAANQPEPAQAAAAGERQCFHASQVNGFHAVDRDTVQVNVGARGMYELEILGTCPDVNWTQRIAIRATGGGSWVCRGHDAELVVPSPMGVQRCPVTSVRRLSPEEVQAARASRRR